ncbi:MAG: hypothetical protein LBR68_01750 [Lachnoclostridium sp.]|jgi:hypothetical protein|nr:hypothetical protein [Lachnoclostridium sp.]
MNYRIYFNKTTGQKIQTIARATAVPSMQDVICYQELYNDFDFFVISKEEFQDKFSKDLEGIPEYQRKGIEKRMELPEKTRRIEEKRQKT